jgi:hypothetical protein
MAGTRIEKVKMQVRTRLKGEALERELANHMATLKERDRIEEAKAAATKDFKKELKEKDGVIAEQRLTLDKGELGNVEVEVVTGARGKKTYRRTDTGETLDDDDMPEQMDLAPEDGDEALAEAGDD